MSNGSYACYCKTLVVRYFNFEFILFVDRNVMLLVNIIGLNGKHIEAHLNYLYLEKKYLLVLILIIFDHFNRKTLLSLRRWNKMRLFITEVTDLCCIWLSGYHSYGVWFWRSFFYHDLTTVKPLKTSILSNLMLDFHLTAPNTSLAP